MTSEFWIFFSLSFVRSASELTKTCSVARGGGDDDDDHHDINSNNNNHWPIREQLIKVTLLDCLLIQIGPPGQASADGRCRVSMFMWQFV